MGIRSWISRLAGRPSAPKPESRPAKSFDESRRIEQAHDSRFRGIRTVPLDRIVGSVGRYQDFDERFRLRTGKASERLESIRQAMMQGRPLPPVKLYQIKDDYYVLDGNHRIAAANALGHDDILGQIVEFIPSGNTLENIVYRQRSEFQDQTGLSTEIPLTEVGQYDVLLGQIEDHRRHLEKAKGGAVSLQEAAADWARTIYRPLCAIIRKARLLSSFPGRTLADLYVYISRHQWMDNRQRRYGMGIDGLIPGDMEAFREKMANVEGGNYPEMQRAITAFVLMNVQAKREFKIMEKLFDLDEVREIHSVHGDADILVKISLTRDLLSSDAEIISQFVHESIRQLPGVISTKTLIPGFSKTKGQPPDR